MSNLIGVRNNTLIRTPLSQSVELVYILYKSINE